MRKGIVAGVLLLLLAVIAGCSPGELDRPFYAPDVYPNADNTGNLGSASLTWQDAYINNINGAAYAPAAPVATATPAPTATPQPAPTLVPTATPIPAPTPQSTPTAYLAYDIVKTEGTPLPARRSVNFSGAGIICADNAGTSDTDCAVSGSAGPAPTPQPTPTPYGAYDTILSNLTPVAKQRTLLITTPYGTCTDDVVNGRTECVFITPTPQPAPTPVDTPTPQPAPTVIATATPQTIPNTPTPYLAYDSIMSNLTPVAQQRILHIDGPYGTCTDDAINGRTNCVFVTPTPQPAPTPVDTPTPIPAVATATPQTIPATPTPYYAYDTLLDAALTPLAKQRTLYIYGPYITCSDNIVQARTECVAVTPTPIPPVATATPIPAVATATPAWVVAVTTATPPTGTYPYWAGTPGPVAWVTPLATPTPAPTATPQTTVSGNAGSATILQTGRLINGVSFNGSADITAPVVNATEAATSPVADNTSTAVGAGIRFYAYFTLPATESYYTITGIEWKNGATVNGNTTCGVELVNAIPPTLASVLLVAMGPETANAGTSATQRVSLIHSNLIAKSTKLGVFCYTASTTQTYRNLTAQASQVRTKAVTYTADLPNQNTTAWGAAVTVQYYLKVYYVGIK